MFTIYCHIHRDSGRRYVGQTKKTMLQRWNQHVYTSGLLVKKGWSHFANAIRAYGKDAFDHEVLETCETLEEANAAEQKWIAHFDATNPEKGFNFKKGGDHRPHPVKNPWDRPEFREKHPTVVDNVMNRPEVRANHRKAMRDVCNTPEGRERARAAAKPGKVLSDEHREKIRQNNAMKDPEKRARVSEAMRAANALKPKRTLCKHGHSLEDAYFHRSTSSYRCRTCQLERDKRRRGTLPAGTTADPFRDKQAVLAAALSSAKGQPELTDALVAPLRRRMWGWPFRCRECGTVSRDKDYVHAPEECAVAGVLNS